MESNKEEEGLELGHAAKRKLDAFVGRGRDDLLMQGGDGGRIFIELMTSDRKLKASKEGSK